MAIQVPKRYIMAVLSFLGFFNLYLMRGNMGVALVAMVKTEVSNHLQHHVHHYLPTNSTPNNYTLLTSMVGNNLSTNPLDFGEGCHDWHPNSNKTGHKGGDFEWDRKTQGAILSSFFFGYIFSQLPGGYLATRYGPVRILGVGIAMSGLLTLLTPLAAMTNVYLLIVVRALLGLFEGCYIPASHVVWSRWAPPYERTKLVAFSFAGSHIGIVVAMFASGAIANFINWQSIFYFCGVFALIWAGFWLKFAHDSPSDPKANVTREELSHILDVALTKEDAEDAGQPDCEGGGCDSEMTSRRPTASSTASTVPCIERGKREDDIAILKEKAARAVAKAAAAAANRPSPPWLKFVTSPPVYAVACAHISHTWFLYTLMTQMAIYLNDELHLPIITNGFLSASPFLCFFIGQVTGSMFCDWLRVNSRFSTTVIRKSFFGVGALCASAFLLAITYVGCSVTWIAVIICLSSMTAGWTVCGFYMNHIDIAPQFAGILMGITNTLATFPGIISPYISGRLTVNSATGPPSIVAAEWRQVFAIAAGVKIAGAIIFMIIGSGKEQKWAKANAKNSADAEAQKGLTQVVEDESSQSEGSSSMQLNDVAIKPNPAGTENVNEESQLS